MTVSVSSWQTDAARAARHLSAGLWAGIASGLVIGGIGGRLAMFVLRLTSDPRFIGVETDDGFVIGRFSAGTFFLLLLCTAAGLAGGLFYMAIRSWLPERARPWLMALFGAAVGGAAVIRTDGIDFTLLDPLALAVAMFIALPALYGASVSLLTEMLLRRAGDTHAAPVLAFLPLLGLGLGGPMGALVGLVVIAGWFLNRSLSFARFWSARPVVVAGRAAFAAVTVFALWQLGRDVVEVL